MVNGRLFSTEEEYDEAINNGEYVEPWVAYIDDEENPEVRFNEVE